MQMVVAILLCFGMFWLFQLSPFFSMFVYVCKNPVVLRQLGSTTAVFLSITAAVEISGGYS